jgi:hypothetical protein
VVLTYEQIENIQLKIMVQQFNIYDYEEELDLQFDMLADLENL